uniref:Putative DNA binding, helix-turn-helix domain containing protein n=1 Tax=viral metagenome TaxID=1070528 RepID=A0A6M3Y0P0_9ZZZZ
MIKLQHMMKKKKLLTPAEWGKKNKVHWRTVYRLIKAGKIPCIKVQRQECVYRIGEDVRMPE